MDVLFINANASKEIYQDLSKKYSIQTFRLNHYETREEFYKRPTLKDLKTSKNISSTASSMISQGHKVLRVVSQTSRNISL